MNTSVVNIVKDLRTNDFLSLDKKRKVEQNKLSDKRFKDKLDALSASNIKQLTALRLAHFDEYRMEEPAIERIPLDSLKPFINGFSNSMKVSTKEPEAKSAAKTDAKVEENREIENPQKATNKQETNESLANNISQTQNISQTTDAKKENIEGKFSDIKTKRELSDIIRPTANDGKNLAEIVESKIKSLVEKKLNSPNLDSSSELEKISDFTNKSSILKKFDDVKIISKEQMEEAIGQEAGLDDVQKQFEKISQKIINHSDTSTELNQSPLAGNATKSSDEEGFIGDDKIQFGKQINLEPQGENSTEQSGENPTMEFTKQENSNFNSENPTIKNEFSTMIANATRKEMPAAMTVKTEQTQVFREQKIEDVMKNTLKIIKSANPNEEITAKMTLNPKSLGTVFVEIKMSDKNASVNFKAENKETLELLERNISSLKEQLQNEGITSKNFSTELNKDSNTDWGKNGGEQSQNKKQDQKLHKEFTESFKFLNDFANIEMQ